jgi:hypothetical protein
MTITRYLIIPLAGLLLGGCAQQKPMEPTIAQKAGRFAPTVITADTSRLTPGDKAAIASLSRAAAIMDKLFLRQTWSGAEALKAKLAADQSPTGRDLYGYFMRNMGPWSKLDHDSAFVPGVPARPEGANYYPEDMTKTEFEKWIGGLNETDRNKAAGFFSVVRRNESKGLTFIMYSDEYRDLLGKAADALREAASKTDNATLKTYLLKRADAFLSNDYYDSDLAWMELDSPIDVTIGPYESYMDGLFNYKAAFEAFIGLRDDQATSKLAFFAGKLQEIEDNLPIEPALRNPKLGALAPIRVIDEFAIGGEAKAGVQTAAFNLPNDERIVRERGSKRVMLKNVQEAKFNTILKPISTVALDPSIQSKVAFDPFFTHILAHELMHGLGPHAITVGGRQTTVRQELKELYSSWEEAKADISGLFALQYLIDKGALERSMEETMYPTYLAGVFRSVRFGITEAHGKGMALQFNYLLDQGAFVYNEQTGTFSINLAKMKDAVRSLTGIIMTIQAHGDYDGAKKMLSAYAIIRPPMQHVLDKLGSIPVDIAPEFPLMAGATE